jgi:general stress protein 26
MLMQEIVIMQVTTFAEIEPEFTQRAHAAVWCNVATVDSHNRPRSRVLHPIWEGQTGWVATQRNVLKARHLSRNPYVSLAYIADPMRPVYAECQAQWADDPATRQRIWNLFKTTPPPLGYDPGAIWPGPDDPDYGVLRLTPWRIDLYDLMNQANRKTWQP